MKGASQKGKIAGPTATFRQRFIAWWEGYEIQAPSVAEDVTDAKPAKPAPKTMTTTKTMTKTTK